MARADDDEALRRRGRARTRPPPPTSIASMYAPVDAAARQRAQPQPQVPRASSSKMKMASLMAVVDDDTKNKRMKIDAWTPPISISSLTSESSAQSSRFSLSDEQPPTSLFHGDAAPPVIQSFSEEKRRENAANGEVKNGAVAATSVANGDASPSATRSMYDFFFPSGRADANGSGRTLKRKRRSGRRTEELAAEVDLLCFGVDAAKLVPQGLVDRVDVHLTRTVLVKVVGNHVANWCSRAGFAPSFLQEITTLLAAYYPCTYPTLLDEVLAGFLFKRPEFMELLLPAMLEKMSKAGESVSTTKYPVADALVRMCGTAAVRTGPQAVARHDLACRSLLRCLVENNGDRFVLSPWIAACTIKSSDSVLEILWRALLPRSRIADGKIPLEEEDLNWRIEDPSQQIVELLAEEGKLRVCRITCGFVELLLRDDELKMQLMDSQSYLVPDCLERAFKYASTNWSASLMNEWLERRRKQDAEGADIGGSFRGLVDFLVRFNSKLIVKKPEWFAKHVLSFVLSPRCHAAEQEPTLRAILRDYMPFVFGGVDAQPFEHKSKQNGSSDAVVVTASVEDFDRVESESSLEVRSKTELVIGLLNAASARTSAFFLDVWSEAWSDKRTTLPWSYVHALLCVTIQGAIEGQSEFGQKLESFTTRVCRSYYRRLSLQTKESTQDEVAVKFSEALNLLLPSTSLIAGALLQEVLGALAALDRHPSVGRGCYIFSNAVTLHLGGLDDGGVATSGERSVVQKPLVEYHSSATDPAASPSSVTTTAQLLTTLKTLASITNDTGDFTRRVLSSGPVVRLLSGLLNTGRRRRRQEMILDLMTTVVTGNTPKRNRDWTRQYVVQELVSCAYTSPPCSARKAVALLQSIFRLSANGIRALLWVVLQKCTNICCRCEDSTTEDRPADNYHGRADTFAELVKAMVVVVPASTVREVLGFVEQKLASCSVGKTRMNLFLLLLLRKLVVCDLHCGVLLPVVQIAVCPLAPSDWDQTRLIQLQLLKALCTRLIAVRHHSVVSKHAGTETDWRRCEDLVCNERLQSDLRSMVKVTPAPGGVDGEVERTSRACEVLAEGILAFTRQLKQQIPIDEDDGTRRKLKKSRRK